MKPISVHRLASTIRTACIVLVAAASAALLPAAQIRNHTIWKDAQGDIIDCHEGGILRIGNTFYWYGRAYKGNTDGIYGAGGARFRCGLNCYSQISAFFHLAESDQLIAICEQWLTGPDGKRVPAELSCQLWLPVTFDPATGVAQMEYAQQWNPWLPTARR